MDGPRDWNTKGSESERKTTHDNAAWWNLKIHTKELVCTGETVSQTYKTNLRILKKKMLGQRKQLRDWNELLHFNIYQMEKPKGPTEYHRKG